MLIVTACDEYNDHEFSHSYSDHLCVMSHDHQRNDHLDLGNVCDVVQKMLMLTIAY